MKTYNALENVNKVYRYTVSSGYLLLIYIFVIKNKYRKGGF